MPPHAKSLPRYLAAWALPIGLSGSIAVFMGIRSIRIFAAGINGHTELTMKTLFRNLIFPHALLVLGILLVIYSIILLMHIAVFVYKQKQRNNKLTQTKVETQPEEAPTQQVTAEDELSPEESRKLFASILSGELTAHKDTKEIKDQSQG